MIIKNIIDRRKKIKFIEKLIGRKLLKYEKEFWGEIWRKKTRNYKNIIEKT